MQDKNYFVKDWKLRQANNAARKREGKAKTVRHGFPRRAARPAGDCLKKKPGSHLLSRREGTIIGAGELDFRVRDGNGYCLSAMAAGHDKQR